MTEKTLTTENIKPALDALRGELAPWPVVAKKQDRLNTAQLNAANSGITSSLVAQIIANTAAIRALESAITGTGLRALVVASLPAVGTTGILYIVPVTTYDPDTDADVVNYSNEYIWIPVEGGTASEGHYEQVGQTGIVINNGQLTITVNGTSVGTFTANQSGNTTAAITVPTNADYVDRTTDQTVAGVKTFSSTINGTASKAIADEDGTSIKTGYGKLAGNQTWSGENAFSNAVSLASSSVTYNQAPSSNVELPSIRIFGGGRYCGAFDYVWRSTGENVIRLSLGSYKSDGAFGYWACNFGVPRDFSDGGKFGTPAFYPNNNNAYNLGSSSYQWSSVYAQSYYYNGTAWGLDKANVWSGDNSFTSSQLTLKNSNITRGTIPNANRNYILSFTDSNNDNVGMIFQQVRAGSGSYKMTFSLNNGTTDHRLNFLGFTNGTSSLMPEVSGVTELGSSDNKWKTLNGVNPGALSLPDFTSETGVSLSAGANTYTPVLSGWLSISTTGDISVVCGNFCHKATDMISVPVIAGKTYTVTMPSAATGYFYSCLGNV